MTKQEAYTIAQSITLEDVKRMFVNASERITDWTKVSRVNKLMTIGKSFNILSNGNFERLPHILAITNMVREFGEYLPSYEKVKNDKEKIHQEPYHEEPIVRAWIANISNNP